MVRRETFCSQTATETNRVEPRGGEAAGWRGGGVCVCVSAWIRSLGRGPGADTDRSHPPADLTQRSPRLWSLVNECLTKAETISPAFLGAVIEEV